MTEESRSAIGDRREQIKAADRPERLNEGFSIKDAVSGVRETEDLVKLYRREWITVFVSPSNGEAGKAEAQAHFDKKYEGRVRDEDVRYVELSTQAPDKFPVRLELQLPNIRGEFKRRDLAEAYAAEQGWEEFDIVARNSRDDYQLREYGTKKLLVKR